MSGSNTIDTETSLPTREWGYPEASVLMAGSWARSWCPN